MSTIAKSNPQFAIRNSPFIPSVLPLFGQPQRWVPQINVYSIAPENRCLLSRKTNPQFAIRNSQFPIHPVCPAIVRTASTLGSADQRLFDRPPEKQMSTIAKSKSAIRNPQFAIHPTSSAIVRTASTLLVPQINVVTPASLQAANWSLIRSRGPHNATSSTSSSGTAAIASFFLPDR
jgi:hypothetical protein